MNKNLSATAATDEQKNAGIGEILKKEREKKGISIEEIMEKTHISRKYVQAIEEENFSIFPADVYIKGFIVNISSVIGIDGQPLVKMFNEHFKKKLVESNIIEDEPKTAAGFQWRSVMIPVISVLVLMLSYYLIIVRPQRVRHISTGQQVSEDVKIYEHSSETASYSLNTGDKIKITLNDAQYFMAVNEINENIFEYSIEGIRDMLPANKSIRKDINSDKINDLEILVDKIVGKTAYISIKLLNFSLNKEDFDKITESQPRILESQSYLLENTEKQSITLYVKATRLNSYLNFIIDGDRQKSVNLKPNESTIIKADQNMEITIGNYANTRLVLNGVYIKFIDDETRFSTTKIIRWIPDPNNETRFNLLVKDF